MSLGERIRKFVLSRVERVMNSREPDLAIRRESGRLYLERWRLLPMTKWGVNVYLHKFWDSDDPRALHDHPYAFSASWRLQGGYWEHRFRWSEPSRNYIYGGPDKLFAYMLTTEKFWRKEGSISWLGARTAHRVELDEHGPIITLFLTGPRIREWGFWCPQGWRSWRQYVSRAGSNEYGIGRGCEP